MKEISVSAFAEGEGTAESPYKVSDADGLNKLKFGLDKAFVLTDDVEIEANWTPVGTTESPFAGTLDGDNHRITYHINAPASDSQAFFGVVGAGAEVKNLNFGGEVTGRTIVAGVAASSAVPLENCNADDVLVKGENHLAVLVASGDGKDNRILTVGKNFPTLINITIGDTSASELLDVLPMDISVNVLENVTNANISYDSSNGKITADITNGGFESGDITVELKLAQSGSGSNVVSLAKTITIASKRMNEGGDGSEASPYIVADGEQLAAMMQAGGLPTIYTADILEPIWAKFMMICGNSCAFLYYDCPSGGILEDSQRMAFLKGTYDDLYRLAESAGVHLPEDIQERYLQEFAEMPLNSTSSLYRDIKDGVPQNELEQIVGNAVRLAREKKISVPFIAAAYDKTLQTML